MSDTPETDEAQFGTGRVSVNFARRLERERNEERMKIEDVRKALKCMGCEGPILAALRVVEERDKAEELNTSLRKIISQSARDYDEQIELLSDSEYYGDFFKRIVAALNSVYDK